MKKIKSLLLITILLTVFSCSYDNESDLVEAPDEAFVITYSNTIQAIINDNCIFCHSNPPQNGAPFSLVGYNALFNFAESGQLLQTISKQTGQAGAMPPSSRMPQSTINLIEQWINEGLSE